jgi:hypothetical protein
MLSVKKMAEKYYPEYWDKDRLRTLVQAGKLTEEEYQELTGEKY